MLCGLITQVIRKENMELYFLMERMRDWKRKKERREKVSCQPLIISMNTPANNTMTSSTSKQKRKQA
jgi:hypothetical protein